MSGMEPVFVDPAASPDRVEGAEHGLPAVQHLVERCNAELEARGAGFVEFGPSGGRVIAADGGSGWAVGRRVDPFGRVATETMGAQGPVELRASDLRGGFTGPLIAQGITRILGVRVVVGSAIVGELFAGLEGPADPERYATIARFATEVAALYDAGHGLPVYGDEPAPAALADAIALVDGDGIVRSWNAAAAAVTGRSVSAALGRPLPVPLPPPGQVVEHILADGRRLQVLATALPDADGRVIALRDVSEAHRREQARELFLAVTSHELRTPVTVIKGYADTLVAHWDDLPDPARR